MTISPITWGGGFLARTIRLLTVNLKRLNLTHPKLVTFTFYLSHFGKILRKSIHQGGFCSCFLNETSPKIEYINFFVLLENEGMPREL